MSEAPTGDPQGSGAQAEVLHESERTRVTRMVLPGHTDTVIRKEPLGPDAERRLRHEVTILERLAGVEGVAQLAAASPYPGSILLEDLGGTSLANNTMPLEISELISLALGLARTVAAMHRQGVVHRDISPANIVVSDGQHARPCLIDFGLATTFAEIHPEFTHHNEIVGTLAYLAPEQTGRTGRPVDQRADMYALGATMYELATGEPPFGIDDPLRLIHDHLARMPIPPVQANPAVPPALSTIIMHLLEKEPDNRYQSAEGLAHDLAWLQDGRPDEASWRVGAHDFPLRLLPPSRIIGRDDEIAALDAAFAASLTGQCRGVLVTGPPGVGKTSLIDQLRPIVTGHDGWFVSGKFDQYRRDTEFDAVWQAFQDLGRLLLAEPEDELAELRVNMLRAAGPSAGLLVALSPGYAPLLGVPPDPSIGDPLTAQARLQRVSVEMLRVIASPKRPVVFFVDDLQWAARTPLGFIDMVLADEDLDGLLLVAAYREEEVAATHPLAAMMARWQRQGVEPERLRLGNLSTASLTALVADMLHLDGDEAAELAEPVAQRTKGNPYDTVELLNALRHDGVLTPGDDGWQWDTAALHHLRQANTADLLTTRVGALPGPARALLETMACLGGRIEVSLLQAATGLPATAVEERLGPALDDGLLVLEPGPRDAVRFRHDRVQEAVLNRLVPQACDVLRLSLARRLAARPDLLAVAAQQYLAVTGIVGDPDERHQVAELFRRAADQALLVSNHAVVERLLTAAVELIDVTDTAALIQVQTGRHAALYSLGRLEEADEIYRTIKRLCTSPAELTDATIVQVCSLTNQGRTQEAVTLGIDLLRQLGLAVPAPQRLGEEIDRGLDALYRWVGEGDEGTDLQHPEVTNPSLLAMAGLINQLMAPAFFSDQMMMAWLTLESLRMWAQHGPTPALVGPVSHVTFVTVAHRQDYLTGYRAMLRILAVGEARGYEPDTSQARFLYALGTGHWFEPLDGNIHQAHLAREGLIHGGDIQKACHTYYVSVYELLDCAQSLDRYVAEVESGLAFATRTGNEQSVDVYLPYRWLASVLRGEPVASPADEASLLDSLTDNPVAATNVHITRALAAALLDDPAELERHAAAAMPLLPSTPATYPVALGYLLQAMALAGRIRGDPDGERTTVLADLDAAIDWMASRASDAPANFLHLLRFMEAERAWALGDFRSAAQAFDAAQVAVVAQQRPWHQALIAERTGRFALENDMITTGTAMLEEARRTYLAWGATVKAEQIERAYPALRARFGPRYRPDMDAPGQLAMHRSSIMTGAIDLLGILAAYQALSSQTTLDGLRARVVEVLSEMTGATAVHLLLWNESRRRWSLSLPGGEENVSISIGEAGQHMLVPLSAIRYAERTREPLVVSDATRDARFARDPYFAGLECCSMLVVPILNRGVWQALLLLENRLIRGAFSTERLDSVMLIAGQLAVSLDNALVYASLERKVAERTEELAVANERLELLSITDALTGLANRRRLEEVLDAEWQRAQRSRQPIALAMVDVDHFKLYNDRYGHPAGDDCLQRVATVLKQNIRDIDLAARYGGEEFAIVMPGTDITGARQLAERVRAAVMALAEPHLLAAEGIVTVSIGVAAMAPPLHIPLEHLIELADVELYRAKRSGRNRVEAALPDSRR